MLINSFKQHALDEILRISPNIHTQLVEQSGIMDFEEMVPTDLSICFTIAVETLDRELMEMGIIFNEDADYHHNASIVELMLVVRELFGSTYMLDKLASSEVVRRSLWYDISNYDSTNSLITDLIESMYELHRISEGWIKLNNDRLSLSNNASFVAHIQAILDRSPIIPTAEIEGLTEYTILVHNHVTRLKKITQELITLGKTDVRFTDINYSRYDVDLAWMGNEDSRQYRLGTFGHPAYSSRSDVDAVKTHKAVSQHHFEYYANKPINLTEKQMVLLAVEHYLPELGVAGNVTMVIGLIHDTLITDTDAKRIVELVKDCYNLNLGE